MGFRRRTDFDAEIKAHLELEEAELRAAGMSEDEARRTARLRFGEPTLARERGADGLMFRWLGTLWQDLCYGARLFRRSPGFTLTAAFVLSLGIGANTALFSIVYALFVPSLSVPAAEELGFFAERNGGTHLGPFEPEAADFFERHGQGLARFTRHFVRSGLSLVVGDRQERVNVELVDGRYFDVVGVPMSAGRPLGLPDGHPSNPTPSAVVSHRLWIRLMNADAQAVGRTILLDEQPIVVVGIAGPGFKGLSDPTQPVDCWVVPTEADGIGFSQLLFRLLPDTQFGEMTAMVRSTTPDYQRERWERRPAAERHQAPADFLQRLPFQVFRATHVTDPMFPDRRTIPAAVLTGLFAVVVLVWLIATTNVSGLLIARGAARTGELCVRRALGASRLRITGQIVTETGLLAAVGSVAGLVLAAGLVALFVAYAPPSLAMAVELDWRMALVSAGLALVAGLAVGLAPAFQAARMNVIAGLGGGSRTATPSERRISRWILVPQVAGTAALLIVAAVHTRTLGGVELSPGFDAVGVQSMPVSLRVKNSGLRFLDGLSTPPDVRRREADAQRQRLALYKQGLLERARGLPGVIACGLVSRLPLPPFPLGAVRPPIILREDYEAGIAPVGSAPTVVATSGYFEAMGITFRRGRTFSETGFHDGVREAILSASLARDVGHGRDILGRFAAFLDGRNEKGMVWYEVVGIVNDVETIATVESAAFAGPLRKPRVSAPADSLVYIALPQDWSMGASYLVARGRDDRVPDSQALRAAALSVDSTADVFSIRPLAERVAEAHYPRRLAALILLSAGLVGLFLAVVGLYGAVSYAAVQRQHEVGVRAALGATRRQLSALLVRDGAKVLLLGTLAGLALGVAALRLTAAMYPDLPEVDGVSFIVVPLLLGLVVLTACFIPARRAARTDPAKVLRGE
jgi:predicted permease